MDSQIISHELPQTSLFDVSQESSGQIGTSGHGTPVNEHHENALFQLQSSVACNTDKTDHRLELDDAKGTLKLVPRDIFSSANANTKPTLLSQDDKACQQLKLEVLKDAPDQVPSDSFICMNSDTLQIISLKDEGTTVQNKGQSLGTLCYEPPRFPSVEIPFVSYDLIASGRDIQQASSPLGIRQLLISSINLAKACGLSIPPNLDDTSDSKLKSASISLTHSPSIVISQPHELLSPSEEAKGEKNHTRGPKGIHGTSRLTDKCLSVDAISEENGASVTSSSTGVSTNIKATLDHAFEKGKEGIENKISKISEYDVNIRKPQDKDDKKSAVVDVMERLAEPTFQIVSWAFTALEPFIFFFF